MKNCLRTLLCPIVAACVLGRTNGASSNALSKVRSFEYVIAATTTPTASINSTIANSLADLVFLGGGISAYQYPLNRAGADPTGTKLIFGYVDVCEAASYFYPSLFASGTLPSWFGNQNPGYPGLYTVQYWNAAWEPLLLANIDQMVADGYDGVFLDVLDGDLEWAAGNSEGNPVYGNAIPAMATLVADIRAHLAQKFPNTKFYLVGNNPTEIGAANPSSLKNLDGIFNETLYFQQNPTDGTVASYIGTSNATYTLSKLAPLYATAGVPVFGNDYPTPLTDPAANFLSFSFYSALGWIPSVTTPFQSANIFTTGPFMFMATAANSTVVGYPNYLNFISGGLATSATLKGGNQGDYFIGGPGQNTITAGSGNDTIYAHPANAGQAGKLIIDCASTLKGSVTVAPSLAVAINGHAALQPTPVTAPNGSSTQRFVFDLTDYGSITSVVITVSNTKYTDANNFSNVELADLIYNGVTVDLTAGTYTSGSGSVYTPYSNNGTVTFPATAFAISSPFPSNTSDVIDGGAGTNTVVYRGAYSNYQITKQASGSWLVTSRSTAEGPDVLTNIQELEFSDQSVALSGDYDGTQLPVGAAHLINLSVRSEASAGSQALTAGFVVGGSGGKSVLVRGDGPALTVFGIAGALPDPVLTLYNSSGTVAAANSGWGNLAALANTAVQVGAFALSAGSKDAALLSSLATGSYSGQISSTSGDSGVALIEVYDADLAGSASRFVNLSARSQSGVGSQTLAAGFVISGTGAQTVLIRAVGPALTLFGVTAVLAAPQLTLYDASGSVIATDSGWSNPPTLGASSVAAFIASATGSAFAQVGAFQLATGSADSAFIATLPAGSYSAAVTGVNNSTGVALVEIYEIP